MDSVRPSTVADGADERRQSAAATLVVDGVTAEVVGAFDRLGVPSLLLKGPAVGAWLYPPSQVRPYTDVDLLVPVGQLAAAESALAGLGFRYLLAGAGPIEEQAHARTWVRGADTPVDLHTGLAELPAPPEDVWAALSAGAGRLRVGGTSVNVPGPAGLALIVALHALQRGPDSRQLAEELERAMERASVDLWREVASLAERLDAGGRLRAALGLVPGGAALADELGLGPAPVRAVILATATDEARVCALGFDRVAASASWREKASLLARAVAPSTTYLRATGGGGPSIGGLAAGYRRRLRRLSGLFAGYRVWRSAVRTCGAGRRLSDRAEVVLWSVAARAGVAAVGLDAAVRVLDRLPFRRRGGEQLAATQRDPLFRLAGRCLGESLARSQYLRVRGRRHDLVLGVTGQGRAFRSHAWLEPIDVAPPGFEVIHRVSR